jgi:chorismate mutase/prephenate dehydratase
METRVAYLGPEGTFCEQAARKYFSRAVFIPYPNITDVFVALEIGDTEYSVVPTENSTDGSIPLTLDSLLKSNVMICGEVELKVVHNLIAKPATKLHEIEVILSHPQALAQCRQFIKSTFPSAELRNVSSTAKAVELLKDIDNAAAIGTEAAANRMGMAVLKRQIEDESNNITRFFVLGKDDAKPSGRDKTSLVFSAKHVPGSLYRVLEVFAVRNINLTKIESRPDKKRPWNYVFYLDFDGHRTDAVVREALDSMRKRCISLKVLGSYPRTK